MRTKNCVKKVSWTDQGRYKINSNSPIRNPVDTRISIRLVQWDKETINLFRIFTLLMLSVGWDIMRYEPVMGLQHI